MTDECVKSKCDGCGQSEKKIKRKYNELKYCINCYPRLFKKIKCPECGGISRLPKFDSSALCINCCKKRPCIRCGRQCKAIGKITEYGPVCNSCAVYFREIKLCERCQNSSRKLTIVSRFKDNLKVCSKCATRDYETCEACRKYRFLILDITGQRKCKNCLTKKPKKCMGCNTSIAAGCGDLCEDCNWKKKFLKKLELNKLLFESQFLRKKISEYTFWLEKKVGTRKATLITNKHVIFFYNTQMLWNNCIPDFTDLLKIMRTKGLRKYPLVVEWLTEVYGIKIDNVAKNSCSEIDQIEVLIFKLKKNPFLQNIVLSYKLDLLKKVETGRTSLRSIRLAIKPAVELLLLVDESYQKIPNIDLIKKYLYLNVGQAAALTGFINFLNLNYETQIEYSDFLKSKQFKIIKKKKIEEKIIKILLSDNLDLLSWVRYGLMYFHDVTRRTAMSIVLNQVVEVVDGLRIESQGHIYWLPSKVNINKYL